MKDTRRQKKRKTWGIIILVVALLIIIGFGGYSIYGQQQMNKIQTMTFEDMIAYTTKNNSDALITVGIIQNNEMVYHVYGENGRKLPPQEYIYEVGSITKTFTTSLLCKAIDEGRVALDEPIDTYLPLEEQNHYPTIRQLLTHTSGYNKYYFEMPMVSNFFKGQNSFKGISKEMLMERIGKVHLSDADHPFTYSNFGFAVLGAVLEETYDKDYKLLMNEYVSEGLGLKNTRITDQSGDLKGYWEWLESDAYMPAGALLSNITDMMHYTKLHMSGDPDYLPMAHDALADVHLTNESYEKMGIHINAIGAGWMIDNENNILWHNGGTSNFNSYIGLDLDNQIGVVILSNLPPNHNIAATVMGIELLTSLQNQER
ncbi:MAG: serine hydrolase [Christensenellales bacterium]|jgi:CubicO group peptidase (beta-lactamase class C family)